MNKKKKTKIVLLDVHAILHRAYHALPDFVSQKEEPTGALYGLVSMFIKMERDISPDYIMACYDLPEKTYRHDLYESYKAGRAKTDDELITQIIRSRDVFEALSVPVYEAPGFEADDVIGTLATELAKEKDIQVFIVSGDMDTLQLVDERKIQVYTLRKGIKDTVIYDEKKVFERFGFAPKYLPDFKGLRGDPSDNIPGIRGIGEKTASVLITHFQTLEALYKALEKDSKEFESLGIKARMKKLLQEGKEEAFFSKMLAEIRLDAPIETSLPKSHWRESIKPEKVDDLFSELDFKTLRARFHSSIFKSKNGLDASENQKESSESSGETRQASFNEAEEDVPSDLLEEVCIALWLCESTITNPELSEVLHYAGTRDFEKARRIIFEKLKADGLEKVWRKIELPLIPVIRGMEERGLKINPQHFAKLSKKYHAKVESVEEKIWQAAGEKFNINSPKQLGEILFDKLSIKSGAKTAGGARSTRESELEKIQREHPIVAEVLEYRKFQKLLSTYIDVIPQMIDEDGRLRARFSQTGTTTGRMSSSDPNLQNIPIKGEIGKKIREGFVAEEGFKFVSLDYSQIELKIAAFLSQDERLYQIFKEGKDVHQAVASEVFSVPPEYVDDEMRRKAKVINFGILYGMGVNALRKNLDDETSRDEAQSYLNEYFKKFSGLSDYIEMTKGETSLKGYTETHFGRRRYFKDIKSSHPQLRAAAERMAVNAPIQGTQADVIKLAMGRVDQFLRQNKLEKDVYLVLQVHDELMYEIRNSLEQEVSQEIKSIMESVLPPSETGGINFSVDVASGLSWGTMKKLQ